MRYASILTAFLTLGLATSLCVMGCSAESESVDETVAPASDEVTPRVDSENELAPTGSCRTGYSWTCCPCGGCGCRPQWMSPANWCAC